MAKAETAKSPPKTLVLYGFHRDKTTGCWVHSRYEVPESLVAQHLSHVDEPRHMIGALTQIERDVFTRDAAGDVS